MKLFQEFSLSAKTRSLLLVTFITLTLTALFFLFAIYSFDRNNRDIFSFVQTGVESSSKSSELYRMLVELDMDIRDLITVILKDPYKLSTEKESLKSQFKQILQKAGTGDANPNQQKLLKQLSWYRASLDRLLWDYGELNSVLYEVYFYINNIKEQLINMEEIAKQLMIDFAADETNKDALQQAYVSLTIAYEKMLQVHILVNSSIANNDSNLLVIGEMESKVNKEDTVIGKIELIATNLRTLAASNKNIATNAVAIQEIIPLLKDNITDLYVILKTLDEHSQLFVLDREETMKMLDDIVAKNRSGLLTINNRMKEHSYQTRLIAWMISFGVLIIAVVGLLLTRKMSRQLEQAAEVAHIAKEAEEQLNLQLHREVDERQRTADDLAKVRDELEQRVKERTAELSAANRGLALEIEERKNAEYELAREKEQLTVTLRSIGDGVITTTLDGSVVLINKAAEELTGWSHEESTGKQISEVFHTIDKFTGETCSDPVADLLQNGSVYYNLAEEKILIAKDGSRCDISDSCAPITDKNSEIIGAVLVFRDVTENKRMQDEALKSEKLKSVGILAGGIAHDFNNILAAIVGNISLAKMQLNQEANAYIVGLLEGAEKASLRARDLTQQLLTFSKGGEPIRKVKAISEIIKESADFILSGGKIFCEYDFKEDLWPVSIDTGQISQVVQNIIINAIHAMPEGGAIKISCENFSNANRHVIALQEGDYVRISIKDEGPGIPQDLLDKIFDPYFTTKEEGSGLGLALTHSIVTKHQGHIEVNSGNWGTDFIIYLPAVPATLEEQEEVEKTSFREIKGNILIMDDEAMIREIAGDLLAHLGFEVETVSNGQDAIELYKDKLNSDSPFDAVIMDLTIPGGMGGKEAIQKLLEIDPKVKGIVSSGYSNDPVMAEHKKYGFVGMVHKPFEVEELVATLRNVIVENNTSHAHQVKEK